MVFVASVLEGFPTSIGPLGCRDLAQGCLLRLVLPGGGGLAGAACKFSFICTLFYVLFVVFYLLFCVILDEFALRIDQTHLGFIFYYLSIFCYYRM